MKGRVVEEAIAKTLSARYRIGLSRLREIYAHDTTQLQIFFRPQPQPDDATSSIQAQQTRSSLVAPPRPFTAAFFATLYPWVRI